MLFFLVPVALAAPLGCGGGNAGSELHPGQTDFTSVDPGQAAGHGVPGVGATSVNGGRAATDQGAVPPTTPGAPGGRVATVEEADIYRVDHNRLFYLNTYRGFIAYDLTDAKNPVQLGRLPVYGYPVEMFVQGNTVYALLRDVLYMTQQNGQFQFQRRNVSQLVTIDISDPSHPQLQSAIDIVGELREGVSRKIDDTIYVVSSISPGYWWSWQVPGAQPDPEQAWVYSFNVADPQHPALVQKLQIFEGGSVQYYNDNISYSRWFQGVSISATSNALMVVENWSVSVWNASGTGNYGCGLYEDNQLARVSIIDVSDPTGVIRVHTRFETTGQLTDQFKQTYVFDPATGSGTYYGIFSRQVWSSVGCTGSFVTQNTMESWDVTDGGNPQRLSRLDFGKSQEIVRGTAFDVDRQVAYAITARNTDPLYALSFADRAHLTVASSIDGLSGDMTVFRTIGADNRFLMGIGQDSSGSCTGFDTTRVSTNIAVSIIDVRDLNNIRLVQRQCVAVDGADWVGSDVTWNLDQAHKMIGMYSDATANVVTVPVYYSKKVDDPSFGYWYKWQTAVGIMSWDLTAYNDTQPATAQTVLKNYGTFVHPNGQVLRSIVFGHEGAATERMMINLSDTHVSIASLADLNNPTLQSVVEVAPYDTAILRFGSYVVEEIQSQPYYGWSPNDDRTEFRVKEAGGDVEAKAPVATFALGQVASVFKHGENQLVAVRYIQQPQKNYVTYVPPVIEAQVYDLTDPTHPRAAGKATLPSDVSVYSYAFWCGDWFWGRAYWFGMSSNVISTESSLVMLSQTWDSTGQTMTTRLVTLDLTDPDAPAVAITTVDTRTANWWEAQYDMVADPVDPRGFYLTYRTHVGDTKIGDLQLAVFKDYAQRWEPSGDHWAGASPINLPGRLVNTYRDPQRGRMFLAQDYRWYWLPDPTDSTLPWHSESQLRMSLLAEVGAGARTAASLLDSTTFQNLAPSSMVLDGQRLVMIGAQSYYYGYGVTQGGVPVSSGGGVGVARAALTAPTPVADDRSDRLMIFDLARGTFGTLYDQTTGMYGTYLAGLHEQKLLVNLQGDGFLIVDVTNPTAPTGNRFVRTLGWTSTVEFAGTDTYVASGYFGIQHFDINDPALPQVTN